MSHPHPMPGAAIHLGRAKRSTFRICAYVGLASGFVVSLALTARVQISPVTTTLVAVFGVLTVLVSIGLARIIAGPQHLVFYRHFIIVIVVASTFVWLTGQPVLPYLDVTVMGISALVACGRIGCLMVGCCHGRPSSFGICYREWQVTPAFPPQFLGVRLFPIQALESLWLVCIVMGGCYQIWGEHAPGTAVVWFIATYCPARFSFEFARWRPLDSYTGGLSEAQWTSVILVSVTVSLEFLDKLPARRWHIATLACLLALTAARVLRASLQRSGKLPLQHPCHLKEIAEAVELSDRAAERVAHREHGPAIAELYLGHTSFGVLISVSKITGGSGDTYHYALSPSNGRLTEENASVLARLILQQTHLPGTGELIKGNCGVFHLLIHPRSN